MSESKSTWELFSPSFDHLIKNLIQVQTSEGQIKEELVNRIIALIPKMPSPGSSTSDSVISFRCQVILNSIGSYIFKSKGNFYEKLLPYLLNGLRLLPEIGGTGKYEQFARDIVLSLLQIATVIPSVQSTKITNEILEILEAIVEKFATTKDFTSTESCPYSGVLIGILRAVGGSFWDETPLPMKDKEKSSILLGLISRVLKVIEENREPSLSGSISGDSISGAPATHFHSRAGSSVVQSGSIASGSPSATMLTKVRANCLRVLISIMNMNAAITSISEKDSSVVIALNAGESAWSDGIILLPVVVSLLVVLSSKAQSLKKRVFVLISERLIQVAQSSRIPKTIFGVLLKGISELCANHVDLIPSAMDILKQLLLSNGPNSGRFISNMTTPNEYAETVSTMSAIVAIESASNVSYAISGTRLMLSALSNVLYDLEKNPSKALYESSYVDSVIHILSCLAEKANITEVTKNVSAILIDRFAQILKENKKKSSALSSASVPTTAQSDSRILIDGLTKLAVLSTAVEEYHIIMDLFIQCYRQWESPSNLQSMMPEAFLTLTNTLHDAERKEDIQRRLLLLFSTIGMQIQENSSAAKAEISAMAGVLGLLLPALGNTPFCFDASRIADGVPDKIPNQALINQFRNCWFFLVLIHMVDDASWPAEWFSAVKALSKRSPAIIIAKASDSFLETELAFNAVLRKGTTDRNLVSLKKSVSKYLPNQASTISSLSFHSVIYIMTIYHLETLRAMEINSFKAMFLYLRDDSIENSELITAVEAISNEVFELFLAGRAGEDRAPNREEIIEDHVQFLLAHTLHRFERVRNTALRYLNILTTRFPHMRWSRPCLHTLMEIVQVATTRSGMRGPEYETYPSLKKTPLETSRYVVDLPKSPGSVAIIMTGIVSLAFSWMEAAKVEAPASTLILIQDFSTRLHQNALPCLNHVGISLGLNVVTKPVSETTNTPSSADNSRPTLNSLKKSGGSEFVGDLDCKSHFLGEIAGMAALHGCNSNGTKFTYVIKAMLVRHYEQLFKRRNVAINAETKKINHIQVEEIDTDSLKNPVFTSIPQANGFTDLVSASISISLRSLVRNSSMRDVGDNNRTSKITEEENFDEEFAITLFRTAALFIHAFRTNDVATLQDDELLHYLCWAPAQVFSEASLRVGIFAWKWVLNIMTPFRLRIVQEIASAWRWSVSIGYGLFSGDSSGTLAFTEWFDDAEGIALYEPPPIIRGASPNTEKGIVEFLGVIPDSLMNHAPHLHWIKFFDDLYSSSKDRSIDEMEILARCLLKALQNPKQLSQKTSSFGTRFLLLKLALQMLQDMENSPTLVLVFNNERLRERIYVSALMWFNAEPGFYEACTSRNVAEKDFELFIQFATRIKADSKYWGIKEKEGTKGGGTKAPKGPAVLGSGVPLSPSSKNAKRDPSKRDTVSRQSLMETGSHKSGSRALSRASAPGIDTASFVSYDSLGTTNSARGVSGLDGFKARCNLLLLAIGTEVDRMSAWNNPTDDPSRKFPLASQFSIYSKGAIKDQIWIASARCAWRISPSLAVNLLNRFKSVAFTKAIKKLVVLNPQEAHLIANASKLFILEDTKESTEEQDLSILNYWAPCSFPDVLNFMSRIFPGKVSDKPLIRNIYVAQYCMRSLAQFPPKTLSFYLPQIVQSLRYDKYGLLFEFLFVTSQMSMLVAHQLLWLLNLESIKDEETHHKKKRDDEPKPPAHGFLDSLPGEDTLLTIVQQLTDRVLKTFNADAKQLYDDEFRIFEAITSISGKIREYPKDDRKNAIKDLLAESVKIDGLDHLYLPASPFDRVVGIDYNSGTPMQSAAKCPFLLLFTTTSYDGPDSSLKKIKQMREEEKDRADEAKSNQHKKLIDLPNIGKMKVSKKACIFKVFDDCRQDVLALQVIQLMKSVFQAVGLDVPLFPYRVIATRSKTCGNALGGILECVPNCESRDGLGKKGSTTLFEHYQSSYGRPDGENFEQARRKFVRSLAAYAVVCFVLWIKDRHNGNLLIDDQGHVIHIDFGFLLGTSPGGNLGFENAAFKLSPEMTQILGGGQDTEAFQEFLEMSIRAFLAARQHADALISTVSSMADSGLPCFLKDSMANLRGRLLPDANEMVAANFMKAKVYDAYKKLTTILYDGIQKAQNNIHSDTWQ